ncbi:MAG: c-type cytochrome [Pseudomonadota bacterium]
MMICPLAVYAEEQAASKPEAEEAVKPESFPPKDSPAAAIIRGETAFKRYCILCHGVNADGKGRAAKNYDPKPANLRASDKNTIYKTMIVTKGGAAMGRSAFMPQWSEELTKEQITDVVTYLNSIAEHPPKD